MYPTDPNEFCSCSTVENGPFYGKVIHYDACKFHDPGTCEACNALTEMEGEQ